MDIFTEQIVKRKFAAKDWLIFLAAAVGAAVLICISIFILFPLTMIPLIPLGVIAGSVYGLYWVFSVRNLEFEYSVTNGDLTVDKIINKRSRKRVISLNLHETEEMGKYDAQRMAQKETDKRLIVSALESGENAWYILARTSKYGRTLLVFDPNEKVLGGIKAALPRQLRIDVFGRP